MTWARFDDAFPQHPKIVGLSDQAFRLHVSAICYANANLTDGAIHGSTLPILLPGRPLAAIRRKAEELVSVGVWDRADEGCFTIHDFLIYSKSRSDVLAKRQQTAKAGAKGGLAASLGRLRTPESRVPSPVPDPNNSSDAARAGRSALDWYVALNHRAPPNDVTRESLLNLDTAHPVECMAIAFEKAADKDDPWTYGKQILKACPAEGHEPRERHGRSTNVGANKGGRAVRQGDGRHLGASQRVPGVGVDWDAEQREHERVIAAASGGVEGVPASKVGEEV